MSSIILGIIFLFIFIMTIIRVRYLIKIFLYLREKHNKIYKKYNPKGSFFYLFYGRGGWTIGIDIMLTKKLYLDKTITKMIKNFRILALIHFVGGVCLTVLYFASIILNI